MKHIQPQALEKSFTCPHCATISKQDWWFRHWDNNQRGKAEEHPIRVGKCQHCGKSTIWVNEKLYFPDNGNAPLPNPEMPESVKKLYTEASSIHLNSPRGAAALLRLSIQVLTKELGEEGKNINKDIGNLVSKGLPDIVQQSLDIVRVTGNDAVHPGQIDTDNQGVVYNLFELVNIIVEYMIALPNRVSGLYDTLPPVKLEGITNRDQ